MAEVLLAIASVILILGLAAFLFVMVYKVWRDE